MSEAHRANSGLYGHLTTIPLNQHPSLRITSPTSLRELCRELALAPDRKFGLQSAKGVAFWGTNASCIFLRAPTRKLCANIREMEEEVASFSPCLY